MIRVTSNMMSSQLLLNLNRNARTMNETQLQLASGRKINKPSDDPVGITYSPATAPSCPLMSSTRRTWIARCPG